MTTWDNGDATITHREFWGKAAVITYQITGVAGDTGGTLTLPFKKIYNWVCNANQAAAMVAAIESRTAAKTIVVTYTNPVADHTVYITAWGMKD